MGKVAFIDADDTLWTVVISPSRFKKKARSHIITSIISECTPPFKVRDKGELVDSKGTCRVYLHPLAKETLEDLKNKGYKNIVLSINFREPVVDAVRALNLPVDTVIADINLNKEAVVEGVQAACRPEEIIVVDDMIHTMNLPKHVKKYIDISELEGYR